MPEFSPLTIFYGAGILGTAIFLIKLFLGFIGDSGHDTDSFHVDAHDPGSDQDIKFFSIQTISIFILSFGWMGVFLKMNTAMETAFLFLISFGFAVVPTAFEIWLFAKLKGLEEISEKNPAEAIGKIGKVYLTIPENGIGEIEIAFGGGLRIWKAKSLNGNRIESFSQIKVEQFDGSILIVSKV